ncbi:hypothetical protein PMZ80_010064 [Knufia obscura]|uniref:Uncharacterized protein n=1 Tax=Knufia obscura TaxID=1635080 RepID=A0ABR0RBF2_9EURO|nr:hypothetical protein PMZ80_010064 [Knufia obscura]
MPPSQDVFASADISQSAAITTQPLTPPPESSPLNQRMRSSQAMRTSYDGNIGSDDNTATGMAMSQEDSIYLTPAASPTTTTLEEKEAVTGAHSETKIEDDAIKQSCQTRSSDAVEAENTSHGLPETASDASDAQSAMPHAPEIPGLDQMELESVPSKHILQSTPSRQPEETSHSRERPTLKGLADVDLSLDRSSNISPWDMSDKRPSSRSPSALFQPYAKYTGNQQSDRQTYNVEVTILTVDMEQSSMSGYLAIHGLTPEHPLLQTFFTGEIVGGPNQRYSFKTMDPSWGANDKVDLQHWLRFPSWRHMSSQAKRDMSFDYPQNHEPWWTQDHVFMRWKEHFLVPDHRQSNIAGASFEGFYYICMNMAEGKISGVYFHSKSEK